MTANPIIRQGDVLLVPITKAPAQLNRAKAENGRVILAYGEATGHHHSFALHDRIALFRDDAGGSYLTIGGDAPAALEHQEHTALPVEPGVYQVVIQRTFEAGMARRVAD